MNHRATDRVRTYDQEGNQRMRHATTTTAHGDPKAVIHEVEPEENAGATAIKAIRSYWDGLSYPVEVRLEGDGNRIVSNLDERAMPPGCPTHLVPCSIDWDVLRAPPGPPTPAPVRFPIPQRYERALRSKGWRRHRAIVVLGTLYPSLGRACAVHRLGRTTMLCRILKCGTREPTQKQIDAAFSTPVKKKGKVDE